jgi:uncharacterized MAPEG superfamily protein
VNVGLAIRVNFFYIKKFDVPALRALVWIAFVSFSGVGVISKFADVMSHFFFSL